MCRWGVIWLAVSGVSGRSELCSFHTVSFWTPSSSTLCALTQTAEEEKWRGGKRETNRRNRENSSVCNLQCNMISCLGNRKCVMFSAGLKFTLTPASTSSAAGAQLSTACTVKLSVASDSTAKRSRSEPECLCCVCVQWEGTVFPLGKVR